MIETFDNEQDLDGRVDELAAAGWKRHSRAVQRQQEGYDGPNPRLEVQVMFRYRWLCPEYRVLACFDYSWATNPA